MAFPAPLTQQHDQILMEENSFVRILTLNRPQKLNAFSYTMILQLLKCFKEYEMDPNVKLIMVKGMGKAFSAGGDAVVVVRLMTEGHWIFGCNIYRKILTLKYVIATYTKPQVSIINGIVMGAGAGVSIHGKFRVVTENAVFAMPELSLGAFPDVGASYFLSRLAGFFGEYVGLTGTRLDGTEMLACGLATHFVLSKDLPLLEAALKTVNSSDPVVVSSIIDQFTTEGALKDDSAIHRLDVINNCFSKATMEEILWALEHEALNGMDKWIATTIKSLKSAPPTGLKLFLRAIRKGREQDIGQCLMREYRMISHYCRRTVTNDLYEGCRAMLVDKDRKPKWEPSKLELVSDEMIDEHFKKVDDEDWEDLKLPNRQNLANQVRANL